MALVKQDSDSSTEGSYFPNGAPGSTALRPNSLNLPIGIENRGQTTLTIPTPSLGDIDPVLLTPEFERILQHLKASPQTPGSFLNPKFVTDEQEKFANVFSQKLNELKDQGCFPTLTPNAGQTGIILNQGNQAICGSSAITPQQFIDISHFAGMLKSAQQPQDQIPSQHSLILLSPTGVDTHNLGNHALGHSLFNHITTDASCNTIVIGAHNTGIPSGSVAVSIPQQQTFTQKVSNGTVQMPVSFSVGLPSNNQSQSVINTDPTISLELADKTSITSIITECHPTTTNTAGSEFHPLHINTTDTVHVVTDGGNGVETTPHGTDTRPSSIANSVDNQDSRRPPRCLSSASSQSSSSHPNTDSSKLDISRSSNASSARLDPSEQSKMRLERKRARNRDAARKCRERKIGLIRTLEKDLAQLTEENKILKSKLTRSRTEVERLKLFVISHLEEDCPALSG